MKVKDESKSAIRFSVMAVVAVLVVLLPYFWMIITSFRTRVDILTNPGRIMPTRWVISGYVKVLTETPFFSWFRNSMIITISVVTAVLFTSSLTGFVFAKYKFKWKGPLFWVLLATMMVPSQVTMIPSFLVINAVGLYDSLNGLIVPAVVSAFGIYLCRQFCEDIPDSLCEAALVDGAGPLFMYYGIILPLLRPCLAALGIFTFLVTWNDYLMPLILLEKVKNMTLPVSLSFFQTRHGNDMGAVMAASALIMLPVTIVFLCFQKHFIKGITLTGVK
jgi:ABC-type glycerol-3-phosphate transport system permease component